MLRAVRRAGSGGGQTVTTAVPAATSCRGWESRFQTTAGSSRSISAVRTAARRIIGERPDTGITRSLSANCPGVAPKRLRNSTFTTTNRIRFASGSPENTSAETSRHSPQSTTSERGRRQNGATEPVPSAGRPREEPLTYPSSTGAPSIQEPRSLRSITPRTIVPAPGRPVPLRRCPVPQGADGGDVFNSPSEVVKYIEEEDVEFIDIRFCDLPGVMQHFNIPASTFDEEAIETGQLFDGSSIRGFQAIHESDMKLIPDL